MSTAARVPLMRPWFGPEEAQATADALASGWVAQGPRVAAFEAAFAHTVGAGNAIATSSGTTALHLAMIVADIGPGDEVVVPSLSYIATANAPGYAGADVVFADVDGTTQNLTAATIEKALTPRTRAVIVVHQVGVPADLDAIHDLCDAREITVVEDAACALGATCAGRPIGNDSDLAVFSFHPRKVITTGEGGMAVTSRDGWAERLRRLRDHGSTLSATARFESTDVVVEDYVETGFNYRMSDLAGAVGGVQLTRLDGILARRRELAERYIERLADVTGVEIIADPPYGRCNFQSFCIVLADDSRLDRDELLRALRGAGIGATRGIMAAHLEPVFRDAGPFDLPTTERLTARSLILPLFHDMTEVEQDRVVDVIRAAVAR